jgi:replication factor A1
VREIKQVNTGNGAARFRVQLTDSVKNIPAMIATQNNEMITDGTLAVDSIIRLCEFTFNYLQQQPIIILLSFTVLGSGPPAAAMETPQQHTPAPAMPPAAPVRAAPSPYGGQGAYGGGGGYAAASNSRPVTRMDADTSVMPISSLNPYTNKWTIKARITNKSDIRRWSNAKGEGQLFNIELLDATGGEIRGTFFKENCEKWYPILEQGKVYTFSGGQLKVADRKYNNLKSDYEISFNTHTEINPTVGGDEDDAIKLVQYHFVNIAALGDAALNATVDVLVVVRAASDCSEIVSAKQGGKILFKRDLTVYDASGCECRLTMWGDKAQADADQLVNQILGIKSVRVGEYNGRNLSLGGSSTYEVNPDIPAAHELYKFKESEASTTLTSLSTGGKRN